MATSTSKKEWLEEAAPDGITDKAGAEAALAGASYQKSQAVLDAEQQLAEHQAAKPGEYVSAYQSRIDSLLDQVLNRADFTYDFNADPLYQAYKDQYTHQGRLAMQDALAGAAGLTGGYGSSYGASAGSQAYQGYLNQLTGMLPELYETALKTYAVNGQALFDRLDALTTQEKNARAASEDQVADYYTGLARYAALAKTAYDQDYGEYQDLLDSLTDLRDYYAGQEQQAVKNELNQKEYELAVQKFQESIRQWEAEQLAAREKWQAQLAWQQQKFAQELARLNAGSSSRSSSGGSPGSASGGTSAAGQKKKAGYLASAQASSQKR